MLLPLLILQLWDNLRSECEGGRGREKGGERGDEEGRGRGRGRGRGQEIEGAWRCTGCNEEG
eukprot:352995-Hanusia_phi.AAC.6